jgi:hypothetical protein
MSNQIVSNVSYPVSPGTTVLLSIDCQFRRASRAWRARGGAVAHVQTA